MKKVSIIGLGWLGMPLALSLAGEGYTVAGSKTTLDGVEAARMSGVDAYPLVMTPSPECDAEDWEQLLNCDVLIITLPASREPERAEIYRQSVQLLVDSALSKQITRIIFISSTSVYGPGDGEITEESALKPERVSGSALVSIENWLHDLPHLKVDILRLAGLVGPDRHPGRFLSGKQELPEGNCGVNLVHQEDAVAAIQLLLRQPQGGHVYNLCAPLHPRKQDYYPQMAEKLGIALPQFTPTDRTTLGRVINGQKICRELGFEYRFEDPALMPLL
ncbi:SDR family oxidoreductase [Limnobaculum parvum]|uniref:SDR family NAD(P)-dependent oxidoreductase n=1 Tax=Limnobaculum parvum TaxID=2172103 RepID=A0A2Y9TV26_9GAMM|nr:SDR family oxidoreductase [Limnobaculum parvum]AWH87567.1 SDR family NAD(P)-dependent oxidoreductase [Limnobaculum parvum]